MCACAHTHSVLGVALNSGKTLKPVAVHLKALVYSVHLLILLLICFVLLSTRTIIHIFRYYYLDSCLNEVACPC